MADKFHCRFCRKEQPTDGRLCLGCGAFKENAEYKPKPRVKPARICPSCRGNSYSQTRDEGRFSCNRCGAIFEDDDFGFLDDRPDVNAIKHENAILFEKRRRR